MLAHRVGGSWRVLGTLLAVSIPLLAGCSLSSPYTYGHYEHAAVAADHVTASEAGAEILRAGGNAVDAAVATSFTLSVVRPYSCGIGGGGFMVIRFSEEGAARLERLGRVPARREIALNYRETCPAAVGPDYFEKLPEGASTRGGAAVAVPGTVAGLLHALERYGTMDRARVLAPAIRAAEAGFRADEHYTSSTRELIERFEKNPEWKGRFAFVWDRYLHHGTVKAGDRVHVPEQAVTLRLIAEKGAAGFYEGPVAEAIIKATRRTGGVVSEWDVREYTPLEEEPLAFEFGGQRFLTMPPPSSGGLAMAEALGILERIMPAPPELRYPGPPARSLGESIRNAYPVVLAYERWRAGPYTHALIESLKHAFADRAEWLGDPRFVQVPTERLLSAPYLAERSATSQQERTQTPDRYGTRQPEVGDRRRTPEDGGTSHFCVIDGDGSAVSCTETVNLEFGSCVVAEPFGFVLNNEMDDFTARVGEANAFGLVQSARNSPQPGKRPLSSMTPTIVVGGAGEVVAIAGGSGGPRIISATVQVLLNAILFGEHASAAVSADRVHHQWSPDVVRFETRFGPYVEDAEFVDGLRERGHTVEPISAIANVQLIKRTENGWEAACDPRKGGRPAGY
ncbi:MAG: gamma-glutamyltransferase family protein [Phycisphaerales bacterium]